MGPILTVVIPAYNGEHYVERAVQSVVMQPGAAHIEIIVINDGSTDGTAEVCKKLKEKHPCVKVINRENGGLSSARNLGMSLASGKYIAFLDCDDWWNDDVISESILKKMSAEDSCDIYQFAYREVDSTRKLERVYAIEDRYYTYDHPEFGRFDWAHPCSFFYKADFLQKWKITFPIVKYGEDMVFTEACLYWTENFERINIVLLSYYENFKGLVHTTPLIYALSETFKAIYAEGDYFNKFGVRYDAETSVAWKCAASLPKCCAVHTFADVKEFMDTYCYNILANRGDIRFGDKLWNRLGRFRKYPYWYWLKCRISIGIPLACLRILYAIPGVSEVSHNIWNRWHRKMVPYNRG